MCSQALAKITPVPNNLDGEYLTMFSRGGLIFGIINLVGARPNGIVATAGSP